MISVTELRAGRAFRMDGQLWVVLKYDHTKMGRGTATIKVKARNLETGAVLDKSFISGAKVEDLHTVTREMTFLYNDGTSAAIMDTQTYEQFELPLEILGDDVVYLKEGEVIRVLFLDEEDGRRPLGVELPPKMTFEVVEADPGVKGDSAANMLKKVTLDNGLSVKVPLFIKEGDKVRIDTRTGDYVERATS